MERDIFQTAETRSGFKLAYNVKIISNTSLTSSVTPREKKPFDHVNFTQSATIRKHLQMKVLKKQCHRKIELWYS